MKTDIASATSSVAGSLTLNQLRAQVAQLAREFPNAGARVERAGYLALFGRLERGATPGVWWATSETDPTHEYVVLRPVGGRPSCSCEDMKRRGGAIGACKHLLSTILVERLERLEADAGAPAPAPAPPARAPIPFVLSDKGQAVADAARTARAPACA